MKFIIAFLCFLSLCIDVFANDSYSLRYGTDEYSFNLTSRVDDLKVYDFIVNRGRCRSGWSVDKT